MKSNTPPRQQPSPATAPSKSSNAAPPAPAAPANASRSPTPTARAPPSSGQKSPAKQAMPPPAPGKQPSAPPGGGAAAQRAPAAALPPSAKGPPSRSPSPGPTSAKTTPLPAGAKTPPGAKPPQPGGGGKAAAPPPPAQPSKSSGQPPAASTGPVRAAGSSPASPRATTPKGAQQSTRPPIPPIAKKSPDRSAGPKVEAGGSTSTAAAVGAPTTPSPSKSRVAPPGAISPKKVPPPPAEPLQQQQPQKQSPAPAKAKKSPARPPTDKKPPPAQVSASDSTEVPVTAAPAPTAEVPTRPPPAGIAPRPGDFGPPVPTATSDGTLCARLIVASDKDVIDDWKERNIHGDVPFNVPVKDVIERLLLLRLKWDAGLEGLVPVESRGTDFVSLIPVPELVVPVALTPKELGWEPGHTYIVWLQRSGKLDGPIKSRGQLYKERLRAFYQYYAHDKEKEVDAILTDFDGSEELLFAKLTAMYGPEPTEQQLRRRRFQLNAVGIPATTMLQQQQPSDIGLTIRSLQEQHLKESGRFDANRDELHYHPNRPSEVARSGLAERYPAHPAASSASVRGIGDVMGGGGYSAAAGYDGGSGADGGMSTAPGLIRHALTSVMTRMNGALLLALYYKRWILWRSERVQKRRICAYLRGSFDVVLRREYYIKWRSFLGGRKMRRQVQQSTQLAAKSEGLVGDLATENSVLKAELKRLRTQVEMLDNNNAKRLETLYNSSELAIGQIRTLTSENNQKEELIQQLEQRLMHVGNLMLQASDAKEQVLEATAAEKLQLSTDNERLQAKVTLLEDALEAANEQLEAWRPKPVTASCMHCEHYFDLQRDVELLHRNSDVLRARIQDVEEEKNTIRNTMNTLAQQLREQRHAKEDTDGRARRNTDARNHRRGPAQRARRVSGDVDNSPLQHPQDYFNASSTSDDGGGGSPPPPPPPDDSDDDSRARSVPSNSEGEFPMHSFSAVSFVMPTDAAPATHGAGGSGTQQHHQTPTNHRGVRGPSHEASASSTDEEGFHRRVVAAPAAQHYTLPPAIGTHALPHPRDVAHHRVVAAENAGRVRTLAESFADSQRLSFGGGGGAAPVGAGGGQRDPPHHEAPRGEASGHPYMPRGQRVDPSHVADNHDDWYASRYNHYNGGGGLTADAPQQATAPPMPSSAALSLDGFFRTEEQRFDERLRMSMDRQLHNRLRTSGFALQHGTIQRDTEERGRAAQQRVLRPTMVDPSQLPQPQNVFALQAAATAAEATSRVGVGAADRTTRGSGFAYRTSAEDIAASRLSAAETYLLRGAAPHERPKSLPERHGVETQLRGVPGVEHDAAAMRRSIFAYSGKH